MWRGPAGSPVSGPGQGTRRLPGASRTGQSSKARPGLQALQGSSHTDSLRPRALLRHAEPRGGKT